MTTEKPSNEDLEFATNSTPAAGRRTIEILRQYRLWADEQIAQLLERNTNQAQTIADEIPRLESENDKLRADYQRRGKQLAESTRVNERQQRVISRMEVNFSADMNRLREDLTASRIGNRDLTAERVRLLREVTELRGELLVGSTPKPLDMSAEPIKQKVYADAELGVIADCLEAMNRIEPSQRTAVTQYLSARAHTTAWLNLPQAPAQQAPGLGGQW